MSWVDDIREFHTKMGVAYDGDPRPLSGGLNRAAIELIKAGVDQLRRTSDGDWLPFRVGFLFEEVLEYVDAARSADLAGQLDALVDLIYVALGTAHAQGLPIEEAWARVHAANLKKERGTRENSKRRSPFDVVKPAGWTAPDLSDLVLPRAARRYRESADETVARLRADLGVGPATEVKEA